jgi:hypothetical protein
MVRSSFFGSNGVDQSSQPQPCSVKPLMKCRAADPEQGRAFFDRQGAPVVALEQETIRAGQSADGGREAGCQLLARGRRRRNETRPTPAGSTGGVGIRAGRLPLLDPVPPDPVDGGMVDAGRQKRPESLKLPDTRRTFEPALQEVDHHVLGGAVVARIAARKREHLCSIALVEVADGLRVTLAQGLQQSLVVER